MREADTTVRWRYQAPKTVDELLAVMAAEGNEAVLIAGGQSLLPHLGPGLARGRCLVDVSRVAELRAIEILPGHVRIGAAVTFNEILRREVGAFFPALAQALKCVGTHTIRNRATVGGSLAWADPRAELSLVLLTHDAKVLTNRREIASEHFNVGAFQSALEPGEIILGIRISRDNVRHRGFAQLLHRNSAGKAIVSVALMQEERDGRASLRFAVGAIAERPTISPGMNSSSGSSSSELEELTRQWLERTCRHERLLADPFHSVAYRCEAAMVLARRVQREWQQ